MIAVGGSRCESGALGGYKSSSKIILDNMMVSNGTSESSLTAVSASARLSAVSDKNNLCAKIEPCRHAAFGSYTYVDDLRHTAYCQYCSYSTEQAHKYTDGKRPCGKEEVAKPKTLSITIYRAKDATSGAYDNGLELRVVKGKTFTIPTGSAVDGLTFMGWLQDPATAPADYEMRDADFRNLVDGGMTLTPETNVNLYARYRYQYEDEWTWSDDWTSATVTIRQGDNVIVTNGVANIFDNSTEPTAEAPEGTYGKTATYSWTKGDDIVYNFSDIVSKPVCWSLALSDDADNSTLLDQAKDATYKTVTLSGRTLYKDGSWNTLCLPFDVTIANSPLSGDGVVAQVLNREASQFDDANGHLSLTFDAAPDVIPAGMPFVIKWNNTGNHLVSPVFTDVVITATQPGTVKFQRGTFVGQFSPYAITADNLNDIILLTENNTLGYSKSPRTLHACRAHFDVRREVSGAPAMTSYELNFADDAELTGIRAVANSTLNTLHSTLNSWYTLDGRRLAGKPAQKGLYIYQGRKVVIK